MNPNRNECKDLKDAKSSAGFWEYHGLARDGINLLLNNGFEESQRLFRSHRYVIVINACCKVLPLLLMIHVLSCNL